MAEEKDILDRIEEEQGFVEGGEDVSFEGLMEAAGEPEATPVDDPAPDTSVEEKEEVPDDASPQERADAREEKEHSEEPAAEAPSEEKEESEADRAEVDKARRYLKLKDIPHDGLSTEQVLGLRVAVARREAETDRALTERAELKRRVEELEGGARRRPGLRGSRQRLHGAVR
jgi:hypothetical protein